MTEISKSKSESIGATAPIPDDGEIKVVIEESPKPRVFSFDSLGKVMGMISAIKGVAEKIRKNLEKLDSEGRLKNPQDIEAAKTEISEKVSQYSQTHPESFDSKTNGAGKKATLEFLQRDTKFALLPYSQQISYLKGEPLKWSDADSKSAIKPSGGAWKEVRLRYALSLKLEAKDLEENGKLDEAAQFYHSAAMFSPQDIGLHADAARLLKLQSEKTADPTQKKLLAESAGQHLEAVAVEMQIGRVEVLIGKGKLEEADRLAEQLKTDFYISLSPEQRKTLEASPKFRTYLLELNVSQAEIADKQGKHEKAVDIYQRFLKHNDKLIAEHPEHGEGFLLRAKIHHGLGDYGAALQDYQSLAKISPEDSGYAESYRQDLRGLAKRFSAEWHLAEVTGDAGKTTLYLTEEIKIRSVLGDSAGVKELSPKLAAMSKEMGFEKLMEKAQDLAGQAHLSPLNSHLKELDAYVKFSPKDKGTGYQLEFSAA
ncbi:MAG: hypothetical protein K8R69_09725 [Deltaproteobacteria bacterium]|nr:hypothetical protein [Deltaproteobacteria bacterium]